MRFFKHASVPFILASLFFSLNSFASDFCNDKRLENLPIQSKGRVIPLVVHARQVRKLLFPTKTCKEISATALYCFLSLNMRHEIETSHSCKINLKVDHIRLKELLFLSKSDNSISPELAFQQQQQLASTYHELESQKTDPGFTSELSRFLSRIDVLTSIENGFDWKVLTKNQTWTDIKKLSNTSGGGDAVFQAVLASAGFLSDNDSQSLKYETLYENSRPFSIALLFCLLGFVFTILSTRISKISKGSVLCFLLTFIIEIYAVLLRVLISGRAPVTNMYETVMCTGLGACLLSFILGWRMKDKWIWALGFAVNAVSLFLMNFSTDMLDGSIQPLVPVLRDNFWLSTHVVTITLSYACFALSWIVANSIIIRWIVAKISDEDLLKWNYITRISLQIGTVLLAAGILLGAIWADYSWGRFWGWDPKETWSLITMVVYMGILHGRYVGWFKGIVFSIMAATGFLFVLMAWFGVNYILAAGLHSYGYSAGGATSLLLVFLIQTALLGIALTKHYRMQRK